MDISLHVPRCIDQRPGFVDVSPRPDDVTAPSACRRTPREAKHAHGLATVLQRERDRFLRIAGCGDEVAAPALETGQVEEQEGQLALLTAFGSPVALLAQQAVRFRKPAFI